MQVDIRCSQCDSISRITHRDDVRKAMTGTKYICRNCKPQKLDLSQSPVQIPGIPSEGPMGKNRRTGKPRQKAGKPMWSDSLAPNVESTTTGSLPGTRLHRKGRKKSRQSTSDKVRAQQKAANKREIWQAKQGVLPPGWKICPQCGSLPRMNKDGIFFPHQGKRGSPCDYVGPSPAWLRKLKDDEEKIRQARIEPAPKKLPSVYVRIVPGGAPGTRR